MGHDFRAPKEAVLQTTLEQALTFAATNISAGFGAHSAQKPSPGPVRQIDGLTCGALAGSRPTAKKLSGAKLGSHQTKPGRGGAS